MTVTKKQRCRSCVHGRLPTVNGYIYCSYCKGTGYVTSLAEGKPIGYHITQIRRGTFGEPSKIVEEALELEDAAAQGVKIMALVELADLVGAIEGYLEKHHVGVGFEDLRAMAAVTKRAFVNGHRTPRES